MQNSYKNYTGFLIYFLSVFLLMLLAWNYPLIISVLISAKPIVLGITTIIYFTPLWTSYNRLSSLDKLDGLSTHKIEVINNSVRSIRSLVFSFLFKGGIALITLVLVLTYCEQYTIVKPHESVNSDQEYIFLTVSFLIFSSGSYLVLRTLSICNLMLSIESMREKVHLWLQKEISRKKEIESLKKFRTEQPFDKDDPSFKNKTNKV